MRKYDEFYSERVVEDGLKTKKIFSGTLRISPYKKNVAYISTKEFRIDIVLDNESLRNRAVFGDVVAVELLPQTEWMSIEKTAAYDDVSSKVIEAGDQSANCMADNLQTELWRPNTNLIETYKNILAHKCVSQQSDTSEIDTICKTLSLQPRGRVVGILQREQPIVLTGTLEAPCALVPSCRLPKSAPYVFFRPSDTRYPNMVVNRLDIPESYMDDPYTMQKHIYLAEMSTVWPVESKLPYGCNVRPLGEMGDIQAETVALLIENGVNHSMFTPELIEPLKVFLPDADISSKELDWEIPAEEIERRRDLRQYRIFTIDPYNAKDLDDALHITYHDREDVYEIGVHIADVSYFLAEKTALDDEAWNRATSIYLVQKVIPMLPPILCEQLCSLNPNVDRLAFSCIWFMKADGTLCADKAPWYGKTVIRSCAKLDYSTAQRMISGDISPQGSSLTEYFAGLTEDLWESARRPSGEHFPWDVVQDVLSMHKVASARRKLRLDNGALVLKTSKLTFQLGPDGNPVSVSTYKIHASNHLVEEYMLLANYLVAQELVLKTGLAAFLRLHPSPKLEYFQELKVFANHLGIDVDISSAASLSASIRNIETDRSNSFVQRGGDSQVLQQAVTSLVMKPMALAEYFVVQSSRNSESWRHYALSIPYYTHFTSPIRRYADVCVHRLLEKTLNRSEVAIERSEIDRLERTAVQCNEMKSAAKKAQERSDEVYMAVFLMSHPMEVKGVVIGIGPKSFTLLIPSLGLQTRLFVDEMPAYKYEFDACGNALKLVKSSDSRVGRHKSNKANGNGGYSQQKSDATVTPRFSHMLLTYMAEVKVHLSAKANPPLNILYTLVDGPCDPLLRQREDEEAAAEASASLEAEILRASIESDLRISTASEVEETVETDVTASVPTGSVASMNRKSAGNCLRSSASAAEAIRAAASAAGSKSATAQKKRSSSSVSATMARTALAAEGSTSGRLSGVTRASASSKAGTGIMRQSFAGSGTLQRPDAGTAAEVLATEGQVASSSSIKAGKAMTRPKSEPVLKRPASATGLPPRSTASIKTCSTTKMASSAEGGLLLARTSSRGSISTGAIKPPSKIASAAKNSLSVTSSAKSDVTQPKAVSPADSAVRKALVRSKSEGGTRRPLSVNAKSTVTTQSAPVTAAPRKVLASSTEAIPTNRTRTALPLTSLLQTQVESSLAKRPSSVNSTKARSSQLPNDKTTMHRLTQSSATVIVASGAVPVPLAPATSLSRPKSESDMKVRPPAPAAARKSVSSSSTSFGQNKPTSLSRPKKF